MNTTLPINTRIQTTPVNQPMPNRALFQTLLHSVLSLFAAQDDPAALRYMLNKNGETVD